MQVGKLALWLAIGFVIGVLLNTGIEAAGIAFSDTATWSPPTWFTILLPYVVAGASAALAYAPMQGSNVTRALGFGAWGVVLAASAAVLWQASSDRSSEPTEAAINTPITSSTTSETVATTTSTMAAAEGQIGIPYYNEVIRDFWNPTVAEVTGALEADDRFAAQVSCDVAGAEAARLIDGARGFEATDLRTVMIGMLEEMARFLTSCAGGEWEQLDDSLGLIDAYDERAREMMSIRG